MLARGLSLRSRQEGMQIVKFVSSTLNDMSLCNVVSHSLPTLREMAHNCIAFAAQVVINSESGTD